MRVVLEISARLENVTDLTFGPDFQFAMKFKCSNCGEETEKAMTFGLEPDVPSTTGKSLVNLAYRCKLCKRDSTIAVIEGSVRPYLAEHDSTFKPVIEFDCRGFAPITFEPISSFACSGVESNQKFHEVDLSGDDDWSDYDEKAGDTVGVYEFKSQFRTHNK